MAEYHDVALLFLRLVVGFVFIYHGLPKIRKPEGMAAGMSWPKGAIVFLGSVETLAGLGVALGAFIGVASLLLALVMLGAMWTKITKWKTPFYAHNGMGWEYDLVLFAALLLIAAHGPSDYSLMM